MNAVEHRLAAAVRDILTTYRPAGTPVAMAIRAAQDTAKVAKPYIVASAENAETPHPAMRKLDLILTSHLRTGDTETAADLETHQAFVNALLTHADDLYTALAAVHLRLRKLNPGRTSEAIEDGRATASATVFTVWIQLLPAE